MNGGVTDWGELFWSAAGRASRGPFWVALVALFLASALYEAVGGPLRLFTFWLVYPALLYSGACVLSKRLHDRGRSGWWAALLLLALIMVWPYPHGVPAVLALPVLVWGFVELGLLGGEQGANRFGPNPTAAQAA